MVTVKKGEASVRPNIKQLREMSREELLKTLSEQRRQLMESRFMHTAAQLEKTSELKAQRKHIARISTILKEKEQRA